MINVGRKYSNGIFNGLFGNPIREKKVSEQYRIYFRRLKITHPDEVAWLAKQLNRGEQLYCPGCGSSSATCHARIIEQELKRTSL